MGNDSQWQRFCQAIDAKELARDSTFYSASGRIRNREALIAQVSSVLAARQSATSRQSVLRTMVSSYRNDTGPFARTRAAASLTTSGMP
ncbi:CoA transferase [Cupriavidus pauculus]|uniref:CoA transferase n=1 Tax=Cupriavidus pauculus TaxID=82633 RepID=UPI003D818289